MELRKHPAPAIALPGVAPAGGGRGRDKYSRRLLVLAALLVPVYVVAGAAFYVLATFPDGPRRIDNLVLLVGIAITLYCPIAVAGARTLFARRNDQLARALTAEGIVTTTKAVGTKGKAGYRIYPIVKYVTAAGEEREQRASVANDRVRINDQVRVKYDPDQPKWMRVEGTPPPADRKVLLILGAPFPLGIAMTIAGVLLVSR